MIELRQIYKSYTEAGVTRYLFEDASLNITNNAPVIILGSSGSGKTTLLNIISGIDEVDSGDIFLANEKISDLNEELRTDFRKRNIGFVFQFYNLIPTLTVEENILLPLELIKQNNKTNRDYVFSLLEKVGMLDRYKSFPDTLSGGEQQRVGIVRALAHRPQVLIADEPTGNLDAANTEKINTLIREIVAENNVQFIMATHNQQLIDKQDQVIEIYERKLKFKE